MRISPGKLWGMRRLADANGRWKMLAIDQRTPLFGPIAKARGTPAPPFEDVARVKQLLARHLAPLASAVLLDPIHAYARAVPEIPPQKGLILSYEHSVTEDTPQGRKSHPIPHWSVGQIRRIGADAVKVLVWYRPDAPPEIRAHQEAFVRTAGEACRAQDITHLLEVLIYPLPGEAPAALEARREELVIESIRPFTDPSYGVDIFKLEPPGPIGGVPDPDGLQAAPLQRAYDRMAAMLPRPWVMLSAGAGPADFLRSMRYACRAGAAGYLAGRAIWADAFARFPDYDAMAQVLATDARRNLDELNSLTDSLAAAWHAHRAFDGTVRPDIVEGRFPEGYASS
ncbi:tagatose 1,6-diphosphate aldolase [Falsiroseomonas oryzae]|uniref:tagatose 1,6-diphosphate aldolase n=1 Tax=Falsiroseomonas oryzae TaxID=2766473 RepID=UPI0022EB14E1|nr:tagatose 1,6-diphosphate aldolase [Roseomonas sp. MO-31]